MQTFYPQNKKTYKWLLLVKWIYYAITPMLVSVLIGVICGKKIFLPYSISEIMFFSGLFLGYSFLAMYMVYGAIVKSIAIDIENQQIIIWHKLLIFIKMRKIIPFNDFEYCFREHTNFSRLDIIAHFLWPYYQSDLRIVDKSPYKIFLRDTYGWTAQQVAEIANSFSMIKKPKEYDKMVPL